MGQMVCETARLRVSQFSEDCDAAFILRLLNEPSFIRNISDANPDNTRSSRLLE